MVDRKDVASWLEGPHASRTADGAGYPGARLGMPQHGPGSVARFGRRAIALVIDWSLCQLLAVGLLDYRLGQGGASGLLPLLVFLAANLLLVGTVGSTVGHRVMGLRVVRLDGGGVPGPLGGMVRSLLLALAVPALIWDRDERGLHDKAARTVLIRT